MKQMTTTLCLIAGLTAFHQTAQLTAQTRPNRNPTVTLVGCIEPGATRSAYMFDPIDQQEPGNFAGERLQLTGSNMRSHVGQKVEVTGTVTARAVGRTAGKFDVRSIRMVAARCDVAGTVGSPATDRAVGTSGIKPTGTSQPTLPSDSGHTPEKKY